MDHLQSTRVDPRKQALLEARFGGGNKVILSSKWTLSSEPTSLPG
jgi:hypothetical protein